MVKRSGSFVASSGAAETNDSAGKITFSIPAPTTTGNRLTDAEEKSKHLNLVSCFEDLANIPEIRASVYNHIQEQKRKLEEARGIAKDLSLFKEATTLTSLDESFKVQFVSSKSDMTADDLVLCMKKNDALSLNDIFMFALQLPMRSKLPNPLKVQAVMTDMLNQRYAALGKRLHNFKKSGGLTETGDVVFSGTSGCYHLEVDKTGRITNIHHVSGDSVDIAEKCNLTTAYKLHDNFDDHQAHLAMPPLPNIRLAQFFDQKGKTGPYRVISYSGKPKLLEEKADELYKALVAKEKVGRKEAEDSEKVLAQVGKHRKEQQTEIMAKARAACKEGLAKKKQRRSMDIK